MKERVGKLYERVGNLYETVGKLYEQVGNYTKDPTSSRPFRSYRLGRVIRCSSTGVCKQKRS